VEGGAGGGEVWAGGLVGRLVLGGGGCFAGFAGVGLGRGEMGRWCVGALGWRMEDGGGGEMVLSCRGGEMGVVS
jgi:hypothetical protein